jgi:dTDP-4-dehydrorhamnose reductase
VFDGTATAPYPEDAPLSPQSAYGRSKAAGEQAVRQLLPTTSYVVRTAWLFGEHGGNFVRTMVNLEATRGVLDVVDDQVGQPTWTRDVAEAVHGLVRTGAPSGTYHATSTGRASWFELARAVFEEIGADPDRVRATTSDRFPRPARRPAFSVLGHDAWTRAGMAPIGPWRGRVATAMATIRDGW